MAVGTEVVAVRYEDVVAGTPISVPYPVYEALDIKVYYGLAALVAVHNTDYTITLGDDFDTFTLTPTASLIGKIDALIALDDDEENYITVRRELDYLTDSTAAAARYTPFTSREFERTVLRFQQLQERLNRALVLSPNFVGDQPLLQLNEIQPGATLIINAAGDAVEAGPTAGQIQAAEQYAQFVIGIEDEIQTVADNVGVVVDVAGSIGNVNTVADNMPQVGQLAGLLPDVLDGGVLPFRSVQNYLDDTGLSYSAGPGTTQVTAGQVFTAGHIPYEIVAQDSTLYSLVTSAGGVKSKVREFSVKPEAWGAVHGVVSPTQRALNTAAFNAWLRYITETGVTGYIPYSRYEINGAVIGAQPDAAEVRLKIIAPGGCDLVYLGAGDLNAVVTLQFSAFKFGHVEGLRMHGNDKCHVGMRLGAMGGECDALIARFCEGRNLRILDNPALTLNGTAIRVSAENAATLNYGEVTNCKAIDLTKAVRAGGTLAMQGICLINATNIKFDHNYAENVRTDGSERIDADGFVVFAGNDASKYRRIRGSYDHNVAKNCEGRGHKYQANGEWSGTGNGVVLEGAIDLITGWRGFDSQTGNCHLRDSFVIADDQWTGGIEAMPLQMQLPSNPLSDRVFLRAEGFTVETKKMFNRIWMPVIRAIAAEVFIDVTGFRCRGPGNYLSAVANSYAAETWAVLTMAAGMSSTYPVHIHSEDNDYHTRDNYILLRGAFASADLTDILHITSINDRSYPLSAAKPLWTSTSTIVTSSLLVRDGVGGSTDQRVDGNINWAKLKPGCDFYHGSGTASNAPASSAFRRVIKGGGGVIQSIGQGPTMHFSIDNGATWRAVTHT